MTQHTSAKKNDRYIIFIAMLYFVFFLSSAILAHKIINVGSFFTSVSTFVLPFAFLTSDIITEVYGYSTARKIIWSALGCQFVFALIMLICVNIDSTNMLQNQDAYREIFDSFTRIFIGNFIAMTVSMFINMYALSKWKIMLKGKLFWLRSLGASSIGEFCFTFICVLIAFLGIVPLSDIPMLIITSFAYKVIFNPIAIIPAAFVVKILTKKGEGTNHNTTNFNPFSTHQHGTANQTIKKGL